VCDRALELDPSFVHARQCALYASTETGDQERGRKEALNILAAAGVDREQTEAALATAPSILDVYYRSSLTLPATSGWQRLDRALALTALGESDAALSVLERAEQERLPQLLFRIRDPRLQLLRGDRRFQQLMDRLGLV
jgi:hypothetical protein